MKRLALVAFDNAIVIFPDGITIEKSFVIDKSIVVVPPATGDALVFANRESNELSTPTEFF